MTLLFWGFVFGVLCAVHCEICRDVSQCDSSCFHPLYKQCVKGQCYCMSSYFCVSDSDCRRQCFVDPRNPNYRCLDLRCGCYNSRH